MAAALTDLFSPATAAWFADAFPDGPTPAQEQGWPAIAVGRAHAAAAPRPGSGKTLAAFLSASTGCAVEPPPRGARHPACSTSRRSRRSTTTSSATCAARWPASAPPPIAWAWRCPTSRVGVRTGDTSQAERQAMARRPPDVLITTPESLYLLLTSPNAREVLRTVTAVIVDEVHAVAATKRGAHLALSLERLDVTGGPRGAAHRAVGHAAAAGRDRAVPGRRPRRDDRRRGLAARTSTSR